MFFVAGAPDKRSYIVALVLGASIGWPASLSFPAEKILPLMQAQLGDSDQVDAQLPAIVKYRETVSDIRAIEVLGYLADDGVARNQISLSTARADLVRDWLMARLKSECQAMPA